MLPLKVLYSSQNSNSDMVLYLIHLVLVTRRRFRHWFSLIEGRKPYGWALEKKEVNISLEENDLKVTAG